MLAEWKQGNTLRLIRLWGEINNCSFLHVNRIEKCSYMQTGVFPHLLYIYIKIRLLISRSNFFCLFLPDPNLNVLKLNTVMYLR